MPIDNDRRIFLSRSAALGTLGLAHCLPGIGLSAAHAQSAPTGYKALVCVFLFGGNDGNNLVIPYEPTEYSAGYELVRPVSSGVNIAYAASRRRAPTPTSSAGRPPFTTSPADPLAVRVRPRTPRLSCRPARRRAPPWARPHVRPRRP